MRRIAGLSQARVGAALGCSHMTISRLEAGGSSGAPFDLYARLFAVLGGRLSVKVYPDGDALRDAPQLRRLDLLRGRLHPSLVMRTEVTLGLAGDRRAWDAEIRCVGERILVECETVLDDLQALERKIALKMQDGKVDRVILLVADTHRNRRILREHGHVLQARFPMSGRAALHALAEGRLPNLSAIIVL